MKYLRLLFVAACLPFIAIAQVNEPVKKSKKTKKTTEPEYFTFPDNIILDKNELNKRVEAKSQELTAWIKKLGENKDSNFKADVNEAMKLFNDDMRKTVTVTSKKNPEPVTKPVKQYLYNLARLRYDNVTISWHNAEYVSNFTKQPDGTYTALVAVEQEFTGIKSGEANYTYHDVTQKHIEVTIKMRDEKNVNGVITKSYVEVFLGNIGVTEE